MRKNKEKWNYKKKQRKSPPTPIYSDLFCSKTSLKNLFIHEVQDLDLDSHPEAWVTALAEGDCQETWRGDWHPGTWDYHLAPARSACQKAPIQNWKLSNRTVTEEWLCQGRLSGSNFHPHPQPQSSLLRIFRLQPGLKWKFLLRRIWSGQKPLPLQFPGLSLPY